MQSADGALNSDVALSPLRASADAGISAIQSFRPRRSQPSQICVNGPGFTPPRLDHPLHVTAMIQLKVRRRRCHSALRPSPACSADATALPADDAQLHRQLGRHHCRVRRQSRHEAARAHRYVVFPIVAATTTLPDPPRRLPSWTPFPFCFPRLAPAHPRRRATMLTPFPPRPGDRIIIVVQKHRATLAEGEGRSAAGASAMAAGGNKVRRGDLRHAVVVRTAKKRQRPDGMAVGFDDNACVLISKAGEPLGTRVNGESCSFPLLSWVDREWAEIRGQRWGTTNSCCATVSADFIACIDWYLAGRGR